MAHILRLNLHALCSSRVPSPALVSKLLKSPDPRLTSWRWYGEGALLEDHCISPSDTDGGSMAASQEDSMAKDFEGIKGSSSTNQSEAEGRLSAVEGRPVDDKWQQMVSNIRAMALKKKLKGSDANSSASSKSGQMESSLDFSDLDLPQAGASRGPAVSNREPLAMNTFGKNLKQKFTPSQNPNQQKSKDTRPFQDLSRPNKQKGGLDFDKLEFSDESDESDDSEEELLSDVRIKPSSHNKNQQRNKDTTPNSKNKDFNYPRASEGSHFQNGNSSASKNAAQEPFHSKLPRGGDDGLFSAKGRFPSISREAAPQAFSNNNGASKQSYMVCVQNLPPTSNPAMVKASMAVHGEVTGLFKKPVRSDRLDVYIQFKTAEAMESALAARKLQFGSKTSYIVRADSSVFTTVVRVSKVSVETDESQLRLVCKQYGKVDDVRKRSFGVFDVFYDVKELSNISSILTSLNEVKLNRSTWLALPAPTLHPSVEKEALKSPEGQSWHDNQVFQALNRIEAGLDVVSVLFEDLKELNLVAREYSK